MIAVRTYSSVSLLSLSSPVKVGAFPEIRDVGSFDRRSLDGHTAVDVQFHRSSGNLMLVNKLGHVFRHTLLSDDDPVKVYDNGSESDYDGDGFWRIASGESGETCFLMTARSAELIDFRVLCFTSAICQPLINSRLQIAPLKYTQ